MTDFPRRPRTALPPVPRRLLCHWRLMCRGENPHADTLPSPPEDLTMIDGSPTTPTPNAPAPRLGVFNVSFDENDYAVLALPGPGTIFGVLSVPEEIAEPNEVTVLAASHEGAPVRARLLRVIKHSDELPPGGRVVGVFQHGSSPALLLEVQGY